MESEIEISETPNWLKELEAKRERRLKTKLGHELGAGAPCLTCEEKCPGLDLHFWRKICKNCKCSKENHEVQDDDIYGWAQYELLGTKVNRLKKKIVLPGRKDEVELEWAPSGQNETIDKYLKTLPPELLPIKGSQAAQDRKQLLKKQIPIHDIDPTLCHELTDEELKKMQEYVAHIKQSSVGVGHLIQINFDKGLTHILDENEAMFLINNIPKGMANSENVVFQERNNSVSLKNLTNALGSLNMKNKHRLGVHEPNMIIPPEVDEQSPLYTNIRDKQYNFNDSLSRNNLNNLSYSPKNHGISTEDIQDPQEITLRNLNYPENLYENFPVPLKATSDQNLTPCDIGKVRDIQYPGHNVYGNSNVKNLVPSAFVPTKPSNKNYTSGEYPIASNLPNNAIRDLPYPSQFISEQLKYRQNLFNYNPENSNPSGEDQNPAYFEPIKDIRYLPSEHTDESLHQESHMKNDLAEMNSRSDTKSLGSRYPNQAAEYSSRLKTDSPQYYPQESQTLTCNAESTPYTPQKHMSTRLGSMNSHNCNDGLLKGTNKEANEKIGRINQPSSSPHLISEKPCLYEDQQKPFKLKSIRDLAYSTYDSPPVELQDENFHSLLSHSVKDRLNMIKKEELPDYRPSNSPISETNLSPNTISTRDQREMTFDNTINTRGLIPSENQAYDKSLNHAMTPKNSNIQDSSSQSSLPTSVLSQSPFMQNQSNDVITQSPSWNREVLPSNTRGYGTSSPGNVFDKDPIARELIAGGRPLHSPKRYQNLPAYALGSENIQEESNTRGYGTSSPGNVFEKDPIARELIAGGRSPHSPKRYQNLPAYAPGSKNVQEDYLQPSSVPIGSIRDVEYADPEIRVALSKDNDLFEGSVPSKFMPNLCMSNLPCCHYCKDKFKQDELAIAIPERSEAVFHTNCFKCHGCNQILADMFYFYDKETDDVYCGRDYAKIRGIPRCRACDELIFVKEYCLAENSTFHVKHFCCFECDKPLAGLNYVMENDQPVCVPCYEITKANKCYACKDVIHPDQQGLQLKDGVHFHASEECFACRICKKSLFGAKLLFRNDCLYCSHDCYSSDV